MVGKKSKKFFSNVDNSNIDCNENKKKLEYVLDLDELHVNVTPPSDLWESKSNSNDISKNK
jgi:hypothetical protein